MMAWVAGGKGGVVPHVGAPAVLPSVLPSGRAGSVPWRCLAWDWHQGTRASHCFLLVGWSLGNLSDTQCPQAKLDLTLC